MTAPEPPRHETFAPRRLNAFGRGYSLFVRVLKYGLLLVALTVAGILIMRLAGDEHSKLADLSTQEKTTPGQIELVGAKYEGMDKEGRAYSMTAGRAIRAMDAPETVLFEEPMADIALGEKSWVAVKAAKGSLDGKAGMLTLDGEVRVYTDDGYEMNLQGLEVDLKAHTAKSMQPVHAQGSIGTIKAKNFSVTKNGNLVTFGGPAALTLHSLSGKRDG